MELKDQLQIIEEQRYADRFELDQVQQHFAYSNEPLIDGIPLSRFLANTAPPLKFVRCANCKDNVEANKPCPMCDKRNEAK